MHLPIPLQWHHNGRDSISNHQPHDCLLNHLLRRTTKKTSKLRFTGLCAGEFTGDQWIRRTNGQLCGKCFHLMTSSCLLICPHQWFTVITQESLDLLSERILFPWSGMISEIQYTLMLAQVVDYGLHNELTVTYWRVAAVLHKESSKRILIYKPYHAVPYSTLQQKNEYLLTFRWVKARNM